MSVVAVAGGRRWIGFGLTVGLLAMAGWAVGCLSEEPGPNGDDDSGGDDDSAGDDDTGDDDATGDDDTTAAGPQSEIDVVGEEEVVGGVSGFRSLTVAADSVGQPHVFAENYGSGLYAYHKLSGDWQGEEPWFNPDGDLGSVHLEIDGADRGWVSFTSFIAYDTEATGEWVVLVDDMTQAPTMSWAENIRPYTGFSGNLSIDPFYPDNAWRMGGQPLSVRGGGRGGSAGGVSGGVVRGVDHQHLRWGADAVPDRCAACGGCGYCGVRERDRAVHGDLGGGEGGWSVHLLHGGGTDRCGWLTCRRWGSRSSGLRWWWGRGVGVPSTRMMRGTSIWLMTTAGCGIGG